jgi:2-iminobutanoate/2-iminopropanoate deaminase
MRKPNRRNFLRKGAVVATAAGAALAGTPAIAAAQTGGAPTKRVLKKGNALFNATVAYGNLVFIAGAGYHEAGDVKVHTKAVLDQIQKDLEAAGSSMNKVLKCNVYLKDIKDFDAMNEAFMGRFGPEPPVRTTIAAAALPGANAIVEIDVIAYI